LRAPGDIPGQLKNQEAKERGEKAERQAYQENEYFSPGLGIGGQAFGRRDFFPNIIGREEEQRKSGSVQGILKLRTPLSRSGVRAQHSRIELKIILVRVVVG
jgi:hypothetical protein